MAFLALLMDHEEHFENYVFLSKGAASQFKLCEITLLEKYLSWKFFPTGHFEGAVDGIGGTLKGDVIKNNDNFFDVASETSTKINVLKCSKHQ